MADLKKPMVKIFQLVIVMTIMKTWFHGVLSHFCPIYPDEAGFGGTLVSMETGMEVVEILGNISIWRRGRISRDPMDFY